MKCVKVLVFLIVLLAYILLGLIAFFFEKSFNTEIKIHNVDEVPIGVQELFSCLSIQSINGYFDLDSNKCELDITFESEKELFKLKNNLRSLERGSMREEGSLFYYYDGASIFEFTINSPKRIILKILKDDRIPKTI